MSVLCGTHILLVLSARGESVAAVEASSEASPVVVATLVGLGDAKRVFGPADVLLEARFFFVFGKVFVPFLFSTKPRSFANLVGIFGSKGGALLSSV